VSRPWWASRKLAALGLLLLTLIVETILGAPPRVLEAVAWAVPVAAGAILGGQSAIDAVERWAATRRPVILGPPTDERSER
jgi:hypothetical protein